MVKDKILEIKTFENGVAIPLSSHIVYDNELFKETIYGQITNEKINGVGRKIEINSKGSVGLIYEGQFEDSLLQGFGRYIGSKGDLAIGWWSKNQLHGYALRIRNDGARNLGWWQLADCDTGKPMERHEITEYITNDNNCNKIAKDRKFENYTVYRLSES